MNVHSQIDTRQPVEQLDLISPAANGGARSTPFEIPPYADDPAFDRQPESYAEADLIDFEQIAKGRGETFVRPTVQALAKRWKWTEGEVTDFLACLDKVNQRQLVTVAHEPEQEPEPDDDGNTVWGIEPQAEIEISRLPGGSVLIHEPPGPGTQSEGESIVVAPRNVVTFAYNVLAAAGFKGVLIATGAGGGYCDLEDGDTPDKYAPERQKPGYGGAQ